MLCLQKDKFVLCDLSGNGVLCKRERSYLEIKITFQGCCYLTNDAEYNIKKSSYDY